MIEVVFLQLQKPISAVLKNVVSLTHSNIRDLVFEYNPFLCKLRNFTKKFNQSPKNIIIKNFQAKTRYRSNTKQKIKIKLSKGKIIQ
jgi:hypothetical protein